MGLALHNYHETCLCFPPGGVALPTNTTITYAGWGICILPNLDQGILYNRYNVNVQVDNVANTFVRQFKCAPYNCPSDVNAGMLVTPGSGTPNGTYAMSSYRANAGVSTDGSNYWDGQYGTTLPGSLILTNRGLLHVTDTILGCERVSNCIDGLSTTLFVGEWQTIDTLSRGTFWANSYAQYTMSGFNNPLRANTFGPASYCNCDLVKCAGTNPCKRAWGSFHAGGVQFLMGDGAVRFISANVNLITMAQMSTIAGSETVADF
jgi:hypothetical protein